MNFISPIEQWSVLPSFLFGELLFFTAALISLWHAKKNGRAHLICWITAIIAGTSNDLIFMALPMVDNFWQAQAMIMLTPKLPLYIPCVYVTFMYIPTVAVWRLGLRPLAQAALTGIAAVFLYAPYDIIGAKFLWWTWHDSDAAIAERILGVPIGSTVWVLTFVATFSWLLSRFVKNEQEISNRDGIKAMLLVCALCTLLMAIQMTIVQQVDGGVPGVFSFFLLSLVYLFVGLLGFRHANPKEAQGSDRKILAYMGLHFTFFVAVLLNFDPSTHQATSVHQTVGACDIMSKDLLGFTRQKFLCTSDFDEDFSFDCVDEAPPLGASWYTVCGKAHRDRSLWIRTVFGIGILGFLLYAYLLGQWRRKPKNAAR